jgi:hypothetical protein
MATIRLINEAGADAVPRADVEYDLINAPLGSSFPFRYVIVLQSVIGDHEWRDVGI